MLLALLGCGLLGTWRPPTPAEEATLIDVDDLPLTPPPSWDVDVTNGRESGGVVEVWRTRHAGDLRVESRVIFYPSEADATADASWEAARSSFEFLANVLLVPQGPVPGLAPSVWYVGEGSDEAFWVEGRRGRVLYQVAVAGAEPADRDILLDWIGPTIDAIDAAAAP
jgi:hypothetical protein